MRKPDHRRSDRIWFHDLGLSDENIDNGGPYGKRRNWKMRTFDSILKLRNHTNVRNSCVFNAIKEYNS